MFFRKIPNGYMVRLEKGEEVVNSLATLVEKEKILGGFLWGLGAIENPTLGYFDPHKNEYIKKSLSGDFELGNLTGDISYLDGKPFVHVHVTLADENFNSFCGHLFSGVISVTGEFFIFVFDYKIERKKDPQTGFNFLDL